MEERAWLEAVYRQYAGLLYRMAHRMHPEESEEAVMARIERAFLALWQQREALRSHPNVGGWLLQALQGGGADGARRRKRAEIEKKREPFGARLRLYGIRSDSGRP